MTNNLVPKVNITEAVQSLSVPRENQVVIGIIGTSEQGAANEVIKVSSVSQADAIFGANYAHGASLVPMIRKAFAEGASLIKAVSIGQPTLDVNSAMTVDSLAGVATITVVDGALYTAGDVVFLGTDQTYQYEEVRTVLSQTATTVTFTESLTFPHYIGEIVQIVTAKVSANYTAAIAAMLEDEDKSIVVCELNEDTTAAAIVQMCVDSKDRYNTPCVYVRAPHKGDSEASTISKAQALNSDRCISVFPLLTDFNGKLSTSGEVASAVAGSIAGNGVPKLNHNFTVFESFGGVASKISDMDALISGGVTPIELKYSTIHIVRLVTTRTSQNSIPDYTRQEGSVRLNVDFLEKAVSKVLHTKFLQQGNTSQVRLAMKAEVLAMLSKYQAMDILVADEITNTPAYRDPVVSTDSSDRTKVNVDVEVSPGRPLNFISLNFKVYL